MKLTVKVCLPILFVYACGCGQRGTTSINASNFSLPEPDVYTRSGKKSLTEVQRSPRLRLSVLDSLDFHTKDDPNIVVTADTYCAEPNANHELAHAQRPFRSKVTLLELLPKNVLYDRGFDQDKPENHQFTCNFDFVAKNADGSTHKFGLQQQLIADDGEMVNGVLKREISKIDFDNVEYVKEINANMKEEQGPPFPIPHPLPYDVVRDKRRLAPTVEESEISRFSATLPDAKQAALYCSSFDQPEVVAVEAGFIALNKFVWASADLRDRELCRIVGYNDVGTTSVSPYFYMHTSPPDIRVEDSDLRLPSIDQAKARQWWDFRTITLTNTSKTDTWLHVPKEEFVATYLYSNNHAYGYKMPVFFRLNDEYVLADSLQRLPAGKNIVVTVRFPFDGQCVETVGGYGYGVLVVPSDRNPVLTISDAVKAPRKTIPIVDHPVGLRSESSWLTQRWYPDGLEFYSGNNWPYGGTYGDQLCHRPISGPPQ